MLPRVAPLSSPLSVHSVAGGGSTSKWRMRGDPHALSAPSLLDSPLIDEIRKVGARKGSCWGLGVGSLCRLEPPGRRDAPARRPLPRFRPRGGDVISVYEHPGYSLTGRWLGRGRTH